MKIDFQHSALLIVDVQNDFCTNGALAVSDGEEVIKPINYLSPLFAARGGKVIATQDWHPLKHVSFASSHKNKKPGEIIDLETIKSQVLWPDHCVQGEVGADFHKALDLKPVNLIIRKGFHIALDSYSAFFENDRITPTGLDAYLKALSIKTIVMGGLATDYCILYSALDAVALGYETIVVEDAVKGVDIPTGTVEQAYDLFQENGIIIADSGDID